MITSLPLKTCGLAFTYLAASPPAELPDGVIPELINSTGTSHVGLLGSKSLTDSNTTASSGESKISTCFMNRIFKRYSRSFGPVPTSEIRYVISFLSITCSSNSTCPCGDKIKVVALFESVKPATLCEVRLSSQVKRSTPTSFVIARLDKSTTASPALNAFCSASGFP